VAIMTIEPTHSWIACAYRTMFGDVLDRQHCPCGAKKVERICRAGYPVRGAHTVRARSRNVSVVRMEMPKQVHE